MVQIGDAKGEYRGTGYRNDTDLKAWLAKRPSEAVLEPERPIIDPHHHFWDTPQRGRYLLPQLLADIGGRHNIVATVFLECRSMYRKHGPAEMAPVGEVEFVNGIAAMPYWEYWNSNPLYAALQSHFMICRHVLAGQGCWPLPNSILSEARKLTGSG